LRALVERCKGGIVELFTGDLVNRTERSYSKQFPNSKSVSE
jgi:hypothetical protein